MPLRGWKLLNFSYLGNHDFYTLSKQTEFGKSFLNQEHPRWLLWRYEQHDEMQNLGGGILEDGLKIKHVMDLNYGHSPIRVVHNTSAV